MLDNILRGSFINTLLQRLRSIYKYSWIALFIGAFTRSYESSGTKRLWERVFGASPSATESSGWTAFWTRFNSGCSRLGRQVRPYAEQSLLYRFFTSPAYKESFFYKVFFSRGTHRLIVVIFALYLPIDWVLRTYSPVAALASGWDEIFLLFTLGYVLFTRVFSPKAMGAKTTPYDIPLLIFIGLGFFLMCTMSPSLSVAVSGYRAVVQYMLWFFLLTRVMKSESDVNIFCGIMVAAATLIALHGIYQFIVAAPIPANWVSQAEVGVRTRVYSIFGSPNIMGCFMVMFAPLTASYAYRVKPLWLKILIWGCAACMCLACLVTFSRGAWLGMAVAVSFFAVYKDRRIIALVLLAAGVAVFIPQVVNRITFLFTDEFALANNYGGRAGRWREGMKILNMANPYFGYGLGRFGGAVAMQNRTNLSINYFYMDNYYLKTLVEMGYIGLTGYIFVLVSLLFTALRSIFRTKARSISPGVIGLAAGMIGVLVHCFTENIFEVPYMNAYFWGMAAMVVFAGFGKKASGKSSPG
ncbi:MAG: O-antigen ligase family protein [Oscillospiraceae bacterium]|jgi:O-antigen ligase|nr:O-antigen ligase family protein [Oscillospiraceae bacterium]